MKNRSKNLRFARNITVVLLVLCSLSIATKTSMTRASSSPYIATQTSSFAYVANACNDTVSVIDRATNTVTATIPVGSNPTGVAITPDGTRVYVTNLNSNNVSVIDTATNTV